MEENQNKTELSFADLAVMIEKLKEELDKQMNSRETELHQLRMLQDKYAVMDKKYSSLKSSKLGKLQLSYWVLRKRFAKRST